MTTGPTRSERQQGGALRWLLLLEAVTLLLLVALLFVAPAGLAARIVEAAAPEARLFAPSGRLLAGSGDLVYQGRAFGRLAWDVDPVALLTGRLRADVSVADGGHEGRATVLAAPSGAVTVTDLHAVVRERTLDAILRPYAIDPSGTLTLSGGTARGDLLARTVADADAEGRWDGGLVRYRLGGGVHTADFPPLTARLRMRDGAPVLVVHDPAGGELLDLALRAYGWAEVRVRYRLVALAGYPWPDPPAPDVVVVEISEQVL